MRLFHYPYFILRRIRMKVKSLIKIQNAEQMVKLVRHGEDNRPLYEGPAKLLTDKNLLYMNTTYMEVDCDDLLVYVD